MAEDPTYPKFVSEFVGTFLLVFTVGCNVLGGGPVWAATSIACVLMVSIYALGAVSGAHFNPAVTFAIALAGKIPWIEGAKYMVVQLLGGIAAGCSYYALFGKAFNLAPGAGFGWVEAMVIEILYTFMLCFVVLNVACARANADNQYYGLAIGFVIVAGGYAGGPISGGCFNPAVAFGIDGSSISLGFGWSLAYTGYELIGAGLAVAAYRFVRPEEFEEQASIPPMVSKLLSEFIGTFFLVVTVGLNVLNGSKAAAWSIAASLMCMIYALGSASGAHFNPAVTLAILASGRGKTHLVEAVAYMVVQLLAGLSAGIVYSCIMGDAFPLNPGVGHTWGSVAMAEGVFTFVLCFVVLSVATVKDPSKDMFGLAIGSCVTVGGSAIGSISGGSLNPAVSFGVDASGALWGSGFANCLAYSAIEFFGAAAAAGVFALTRSDEYSKGAEAVKVLKPADYGGLLR